MNNNLKISNFVPYMKKYIIIEDERFAYEELKRMMYVVRPDYELCGWASSVEQAIRLVSNLPVDLMLVDIRLFDGDSFEIFEHIKSFTPIIFTTAYDEYALRAFKLNSVDYLLKPVDEKDLDTALTKFENLQCTHPGSAGYERLRNNYMRVSTKNRFLIQIGDTYKYVETAAVAFFYSEDKYTYLHRFDGKRYIISYSLDQLETIIDSDMFFRASRNCICNIKGICRMSKYFAGRIKVVCKPECPHEIIVSRNRVGGFLNWINGKV